MTDAATVDRVLVVAKQPVDGFDRAGVGEVLRVRQLSAVAGAVEATDPDVVVIDTTFPDGQSFEVITEMGVRFPEIPVVALTPHPPPHADVALAARSGAVGFIDAGTDQRGLSEAVRAVAGGATWFPGRATRDVLAAVADDLDSTASERRSRLVGLAIGIVPVFGAMGAVLSLLWRQYLGQIGVRPVDIAIDPATRAVDVIFAIMIVVGVFGPVLFVGRWRELIGAASPPAGLLHRLVMRRRAALLVLSVGVVLAGVVVYWLAPLISTLVIGPLVSLAVIARAADLEDALPSVLRLPDIRPTRVLVGVVLAVSLFLVVLSYEALIVGPQLDTSGAEGRLAPRVLGFRPQPVEALTSDGDEPPRELLYLGGNADLYVLVDPCNDDTVEMVSVGATKLVVIDEVSCSTTTPP